MRMIKRIAVRAFAALFLLFASLAIWLAYLGYFATDPVEIIPPKGNDRPDYVLVFLSGDMGFNVGMGPRIVKRFTDKGVPAIGFNSLTYFRKERTPEDVLSMIEDLMARARREFGHRKIVFVGQSFGADALQLAVSELGPEQRRDIALVAMIVPTNSVYLQASPNELFNLAPPELEALPTANRLNWVPVMCIYGEEETRSLCPLLQLPNAEIKALPGGHFLNEDTDLVASTIEKKIMNLGL
jgi:type IV secretory pathway VirJ component